MRHPPAVYKFDHLPTLAPAAAPRYPYTPARRPPYTSLLQLLPRFTLQRTLGVFNTPHTALDLLQRLHEGSRLTTSTSADPTLSTTTTRETSISTGDGSAAEQLFGGATVISSMSCPIPLYACPVSGALLFPAPTGSSQSSLGAPAMCSRLRESVRGLFCNKGCSLAICSSFCPLFLVVWRCYVRWVFRFRASVVASNSSREEPGAHRIPAV